VTPLTSKRLRGWGVTGLTLFVYWVALVGVLDPLELAVGAGAAAVGTLVVVGMLARGRLPRLVFRRRTWMRAAHGLARIGPDLAMLARGWRARGSVSTVRLPPGTDWRRRAERGLLELFGSLAPNTIVFDATADGDAEVHKLVSRRSR
jgi:uncharacterized membrane protein YhaH (DUF805 family)